MVKTQTATKTQPEEPPVEQNEFGPAPDGITATERRIDPQRESLQRALQIDHARRAEPGAWVGLPNGEAVRVQGAVGMKYPGEKASDMLARPRDMMLNPRPDFYDQHGRKISDRYQWRVRTSADPKDNRPAETANFHRAGRIRYVETSEVDSRCEFAVYTEYATTNNKYVTYQTLILCEIVDERLGYQTYKGWEDWAINRVTNIEQMVRAEPNTHIDGKTDVSVDIMDTKRGG